MTDTYAPRHDQDAVILTDTPSAEADVPFTYRKIAPPRAALLPLELRVLAEGVALAAAWPALNRAPDGDGHGVVVVPGFTADDASMAPMRRFIANRGYVAHGWDNGRNMGATQANLDAVVAKLEAVADETGRKVSLIGWSLGGCFVREVARECPELVRQVMTLGSPFQDVRANAISTMLQMFAPEDVIEDPEREKTLGSPIPVPSTAIFTPTDAIVAGDACRECPGGQRESIEVFASHMGLAYNPLVYFAIADRLAQAEKHWRHFEPPALLRQLYAVHK